MKPDAPSTVRGEFNGIASSQPGVTVCEHLPMTARVMDRVSVIRSMHHPMRNHISAAAEALCGKTPLRGDLELLADDRLSFPCYGAALSYAWRDEQLELPAIALPHVMYNVVQLPGQTAGFLGSSYQPFQIDKDPNAADFGASTLSLQGRRLRASPRCTTSQAGEKRLNYSKHESNGVRGFSRRPSRKGPRGAATP